VQPTAAITARTSSGISVTNCQRLTIPTQEFALSAICVSVSGPTACFTSNQMREPSRVSIR
jgi:hypothetical protein